MGKIRKSASASRSGRGQRGAFRHGQARGHVPVSLPVTLAPISRREARGGWRSLGCGVKEMGKIRKSASASRSGRGQRGAFSTRASQGTRPRESTASDGPYLALRSARRMAVSWMRCQRNGQNRQKCVSFEKRARPAWGVFDTGKPGGTSS